MLRTQSCQPQAKTYIIKTRIVQLIVRISWPEDDHLVIEKCSYLNCLIKSNKCLCWRLMLTTLHKPVFHDTQKVISDRTTRCALQIKTRD